jgi:hypothetical protein
VVSKDCWAEAEPAGALKLEVAMRMRSAPVEVSRWKVSCAKRGADATDRVRAMRERVVREAFIIICDGRRLAGGKWWFGDEKGVVSKE